MEKPSFTHSVIAWVFVGDCRHDSLGEKSSRHSIRECAPIITAVTRGPLTHLRARMKSHGLPCQNPSPDERGVIDQAIMCGQHEFLAGGQRWKLRMRVHGCKVGNNIEHAFGLLRLRIVFFVLWFFVLWRRLLV